MGELKQENKNEMDIYNEVMEKVKELLRDKYTRKSLEMSFVRVSPGYLDCKLGGVPFVPEGGVLPVDLNNGEPLYLLLQINFAQIPYLPDYPTEGILQIFVAGWDDVYGIDFDDATNQSSWRIIYYDDISNPMAEEEVKKLVEKTFEAEEISLPFEKNGESYGLKFEEKEMFLSIGDFRFEEVFFSECRSIWPKEWGDIQDEFDLPKPFRDMLYEVFDGFGSRIGGLPGFTQTDPRDYSDELKDYELLLQVDSIFDDEGWIMMWGDSGISNFFIKLEDLKNKDFSRVAYNWDCC